MGEDIDEAYKLVNTVRERSFMKPMPPEVKTNQQLMREYIQRERRVELFMKENVRGLAACIWNPPVRKS